jgi:hypothetical protein
MGWKLELVVVQFFLKPRSPSLNTFLRVGSYIGTDNDFDIILDRGARIAPLFILY